MVMFICLAIEVTDGAGGAPIGMPGTVDVSGEGEFCAEFMRFELISVELAI